MADEWSPDKPLPEKDDEEEVQNEAKARARLNFLVKKYGDESQPAPKRKKRLFSGRD